MIEAYVDKLFDTLPNNLKNRKTPIEIDLVLEGGAFNGSYLIGALYFLKKLEKHNIVIIKRISGVSAGAVVGLLYYLDMLHVIEELYDDLIYDFKSTHYLSVINVIKNKFRSKMPDDSHLKINNKLYVSYHDIKNGRKITKHKYKNNDDIIDIIIKSCFIPFAANGNCLYKNKYMDGIIPFIFKLQKTRKILYLNITTADRLYNVINVKNEKTTFHRILSGLLDTHMFFIKNCKTTMCSYVNDWGILDIMNNIFKRILERFIVFVIGWLAYLKYSIPKETKQHSVYKFIRKTLKSYYVLAVKKLCF